MFHWHQIGQLVSNIVGFKLVDQRYENRPRTRRSYSTDEAIDGEGLDIIVSPTWNFQSLSKKDAVEKRACFIFLSGLSSVDVSI